jgi:hypothetical protein
MNILGRLEILPNVQMALCFDCGHDTTPCTGKRGRRHMGRWEWYMVRNELWASTGMNDGFLCIACLESRIGRRLTFADFPDVPVNDPDHPWNTRRLRSRLLRYEKAGVNRTSCQAFAGSVQRFLALVVGSEATWAQ